MYSEKEKSLAKEKIKYFKILPSKIVDEDGEETEIRNYNYEPGTIIELRAGELERELFSFGGMHDTFSEIFLKNIEAWDYRKPFDFYKWLQIQKPITFSEEGMCGLSYEIGDKILIGPWIKAKILQLFASRKAFWDNKLAIVQDCKLLEYLAKKGCLKNIETDSNGISVHNEQEILDTIMKKCSFEKVEDREVYTFLHNNNFFQNTKVISATQELYKADYDEELIVPFYKGETWDIAKNRELLLGILNQSFYEMLIRNAREIQGQEKDRLFEEEFGNRIKVLKDRYSNEGYYQAIDDDLVTKKILDLRQSGYSINFDPYDQENCYDNGNIKYFSCFYNYYEEPEQRNRINQLASELTELEARTIFPEAFYFGRAYYQMKENSNMEDIYELGIGSYEKNNPNNFYTDGSVKYFWIDYFGEINDFQKREKVLEFADEVPTDVAIELRKADELAEYHHKVYKKEEEQIKKFMKSSNFSKKYQKAVKRMEKGETLDERDFAKKQIEENKKHLRQKRLNDDKRVRKLSLDEMIAEIDDKAENWHDYEDKASKELSFKLYDREIDLDDVIQILSDVILTEDEAKCVATAWSLMERVVYITDEIMTDEQVRELFPELHEESEIHKKAAELVAKSFNAYTKHQKEQKENSYTEKAKKLRRMRSEKDEVEL